VRLSANDVDRIDRRFHDSLYPLVGLFLKRLVMKSVRQIHDEIRNLQGEELLKYVIRLRNDSLEEGFKKGRESGEPAQGLVFAE